MLRTMRHNGAYGTRRKQKIISRFGEKRRRGRCFGKTYASVGKLQFDSRQSRFVCLFHRGGIDFGTNLFFYEIEVKRLGT